MAVAKWIHIINVDARGGAGTVKRKVFNKPLSNEAMRWFNRTIYSYIVGHLEEERSRFSKYRKAYVDSVETRFEINTYQR